MCIIRCTGLWGCGGRDVYPSMHWAGGVYPSMQWVGGVSAEGSVCPGGICWGCSPTEVFAHRGVCPRGVWPGGLPRRRVCLTWEVSVSLEGTSTTPRRYTHPVLTFRGGYQSRQYACHWFLVCSLFFLYYIPCFIVDHKNHP